jgi:hypothetical protein
MRLTKEQLSVRVVVRRVPRGTAFVWEVYRDDLATPVFISPDRFKCMDAAFLAGQARLPEFVPPKRSVFPGARELAYADEA